MVAIPDSGLTMQEEVERFKKAQRESVHIGSLWQPIAMSWIEKWKIYVNLDGSDAEPRDPEVMFHFWLNFLCCPSLYIFVVYFFFFSFLSISRVSTQVLLIIVR